MQLGGDPGLPVEYRTCAVIRVEDAKMWARYIEKRNAIESRRAGHNIRKIDPPVKSDVFVRGYTDMFDSLRTDLNEVFLWHGSNVRSVLNIAQDNFSINLAGTSAGTMYGRGVYLAESCTKADEYSRDEPDGYYQGIYAFQSLTR